ncbi:transposase [Microvirga calopogonii]|uniref:transposase n=1 Tax=Microvirga calopogonii TaxID=2078013 RepID=UPI00315CC184
MVLGRCGGCGLLQDSRAPSWMPDLTLAISTMPHGRCSSPCPRMCPAGGRQTCPLRHFVDEVFYLLRTGAQRLLLPHEYLPRCGVSYRYAQWREDGTREHVTQALRESDSRTIGRNSQPTAEFIDDQPVKTTAMAETRATIAGKRPRAASVTCSSTHMARC